MQSFRRPVSPGGYGGEQNATDTEHHRICSAKQVESGLEAAHFGRAGESEKPEKRLAEGGLNNAHKQRAPTCVPESRNQARREAKVREGELQLCNLNEGGGSRSCCHCHKGRGKC